MVVETNKDNKTNAQNPLVDTGQVTVNAFNILQKKQKSDKNFILGRDDKTLATSPNHKVKVKAWTQQDDKTHTYFHSLSIDINVEDFMGTAELKCPYDSDLMEYWEPIRNYCIIYGSNRGEANAKILFIGRVRGVKQEGYELVIQFQDYGWKFKQNVSQSYANDNVLNKDGYTIMRLMFEALKIDSYSISESARNRLKQVGIDQDGNLTLNKEKVEEMPDLLKRLQASDPSKFSNKYTVENKLRESKEGNYKNINYTLKYEEPTAVMKNITSEGKSDGGFTAGSNIYSNTYGGGGSNSGSSDVEKQLSNVSASGNPRPPSNLCSSIGNSQVIAAMKLVWSCQRDYAKDYSSAKTTIVNYARNSPATYSSKAAPCLNTLAKYTIRKDGKNVAQIIKSEADSVATMSGASIAIGKGVVSAVAKTVSGATKMYNQAKSFVDSTIKTGKSWGSKIVSGLQSGIKSFFK